MLKYPFVLATLLISLNALSQDTLWVKSLGLYAGSRVNAVPYVNNVLQNVDNRRTTVIIFEKGRYDFWSDGSMRKNYFEANTTIVNPRTCPIYIFNKRNLVIDGQGSDFIFHGKVQPITIDSSSSVTIKNVSIDFEIPFNAEAEITEVTPEYFDLNFDVKQFPYVIENGKLFFVGEGWKSLLGGEKWNDAIQFDRETWNVTARTDDDLLGSDWEKLYRAETIAEGTVRVHLKSNNTHLKKGNYLVLRHGVRDHAGVFMVDSKDIRLENIFMHSNSGMNFLAQYTESITYKRVHCIPSPSRKVMAGHDDGLHHTNCKGNILVDSCSFRGIMDDAINFHNTYLIVDEKLSARSLRAVFKHHQSMGFIWARQGEEVSVLQANTMSTLAKLKVKSFKLLSVSAAEIEFEQEIPSSVTSGDALENMEWNPSVEVRNTYFGQHRARGLLVSTPKQVRIHNNIFESSGAAICIPGDANHWYEGGAVTDVIIQNNLFRNCNSSNYQFSEGIISIQPGIPMVDLKLPKFHKNIRVTGNTFEVFDAPILYAFNVDGFSFTNNIIRHSTVFKPRYINSPMLTFDACLKICVSGNKIEPDVLGKNIKLIRTEPSELKQGKGKVLSVIK